MIRRMVTLVAGASFALSALVAGSCDLGPVTVDPTETRALALLPSEAVVVTDLVVEARASPVKADLQAPKLEASVALSASETVQTYAYERHLLISLASIIHEEPGPCPPPNALELTFTRDDGAEVTTVLAVPAGAALTVTLELPCASAACADRWTLSVANEGAEPVALAVADAP